MKQTSAGAIIYTMISDQRQYLLIKDFHQNIGFPKGHLEEGETEVQAACREILEEVGITITLDTNFREELNYIMPNGIAKCSIYFLGYFENQTPVRQEAEVQEIIICDYRKALNLLTFENMKEALQKAENYLSN